MHDTFARLYGATAFNPDDRQDQIGELARTSLLEAALASAVTMKVQDGNDMATLLGGLLVGIVQVMEAVATGIPRDEIDAAIRASIMQLAPWAVDMERSSDKLEPLANV